MQSPPPTVQPTPPREINDDLSWLRALAGRLASSREDADDLVQETWLAAEQASTSGVRSRRAWLGGVLRNRERMRRRATARRRRREHTAADPVDAPELDPDRLLHQRHVLSVLREALDELDEGDRQLLLARYCDEHTAPVLAERLGVPASTVRSRLSRATARVRRSLDERWDGGRDAWAPAVALVPRPVRAPSSTAVGWKVLLMALIGKKLVAGTVAVVAAVALWFGWSRLSTPDEPVEEVESATAQDNAELVARKRALRGERSARSPVDIRGEVLAGEDDQPLAGVTVLVAPIDRALLATRTRGMPAPLPRARTNADGEFAVSDLPPGRYRVSASTAGRLPASIAEFHVSAESEGEPIVLRLARGGNTLQGTLHDIDGGVVEGALVVARKSGRGGVDESVGFAVQSDAEGHYSLTLPDGTWSIRAGGVDYSAKDRRVTMRRGPGRVDFTLIPGATIEGRVVDLQGEPVANARINFAVEALRSGYSWGTGDGSMLVMTDARGRFALRPLNPGRYSLYASAKGLATAAPTVVQAAIAEEIQDVEVQVSPAFEASGFIVDAADPERGLPDVTVSLLSTVGRPSFAVFSEPDGYFEFPGLVPGSYIVLLEGPGVIPSALENRIEIEDTDQNELLFELALGQSIRGRVEPPVAGRVELKHRDASGGLAWMMASQKVGNASATIAADGTFSIDAAPVGQWRAVANGEDGSKGEVEVEVTAEGSEEIVVSLSPRATITGEVQDEQGRPLEGLTIDLETLPDPSKPPRPFGNTRKVAQAVTATDGTYRMWGVDAGTFALDVTDSAGQSVAIVAGPDRVEVTEGQSLDEIVLQVALPHGSVSGVVHGPSGEPVADAWVTLSSQQASGPLIFRRGAQNNAITDIDGRFEFDGLAEVDYALDVRGPHATMHAQVEDVKIGEQVEVSLEQLGEIRGRVTQNGQPVTEFSVGTGKRGRLGEATSDPEGRFVLSRLSAGYHRVVVTVDSGAAMAEVELEPGAQVELDLEISGWATLRGRLVSIESGEPLGGISIRPSSHGGLRGEGKGMLDQLMGGGGPRTADDGTFEIEGVGAGPGTLYFRVAGIGFGGESLGSSSFTVDGTGTVELGDIRAFSPAGVDKDARGTLGMRMQTRAEFAVEPRSRRRRAPDTRTKHLWVTWVDPAGPASQAGLRQGDQIVAIDGRTEEDLGAQLLSTMLSDARVKTGTSYRLSALREEQPLEVTVEAVATK